MLIKEMKPESARLGLGGFTPTVLLNLEGFKNNLPDWEWRNNQLLANKIHNQAKVAVDFTHNEWAFFMNGKLLSRTPLKLADRKLLIKELKFRIPGDKDFQRLQNVPVKDRN